MFEIKNTLSAEELTEINDALEGQNYVDGREAAANAASLVKRNTQLPVASDLRAQMSQKIEKALRHNQMFVWLTMPKRIGPFHLTRYEETHNYGDHVDNSIMGLPAGAPMRADISMTVFPHNPEDYDNGELIMNSRINPQAIKLPAGGAFIYPTGEFHPVEPVTRGVRSVAITMLVTRCRTRPRSTNRPPPTELFGSPPRLRPCLSPGFPGSNTSKWIGSSSLTRHALS